jgi:hypothetical protein
MLGPASRRSSGAGRPSDFQSDVAGHWLDLRPRFSERRVPIIEEGLGVIAKWACPLGVRTGSLNRCICERLAPGSLRLIILWSHWLFGWPRKVKRYEYYADPHRQSASGLSVPDGGTGCCVCGYGGGQSELWYSADMADSFPPSNFQNFFETGRPSHYPPGICRGPAAQKRRGVFKPTTVDTTVD